MRKQELEVYSEASNAAVVRAPGRQYPGLVVQGDTLANLHGLASLVAERCTGGEATELKEMLDGLLRHYERVLGEYGLALPYQRIS